MKKIKSTTKITAFYILILMLIAIFLYLLLPVILNYPPNSIDGELQREIDGISYTTQTISIVTICMLINIIILAVNIRKINKLTSKLKNNKIEKQNILDRITKLCIRTPILLYATQTIIPLVMMPIILTLIGAELIVVFKISAIYILFLSLSAAITYLYAQKEFKKLLVQIYSRNTHYKNNIMKYNPKLSMRFIIALELMTLIIISLLFTSLLAYTMNSRTTGDVYYRTYNVQLSNIFDKTTYRNTDEIMEKLKTISKMDDNIKGFIIDNNSGEYKTTDNSEISKFFIRYAMLGLDENRAYDYYCIDREGTFIKLNTRRWQTVFSWFNV